MWCAPKLDAPQATPRRPLRVSGTIQSRARRPPAPPPLPPPGDPSSTPHRSILWYMAGLPPRGSRRGRQSLGRKKRRGSRGSSGSRRAAGPAASPRQGTHPIPPSDSLLWVLESAVPCTQNNPKHSRGECSWQGTCPERQPRRTAIAERVLQKYSPRVSGESTPPGGSSLLHDSHPPGIH
ncbi:unknown_gene_16247 [Phodopus roborovskii]|uniref:Unknown_gene_16247 protein n=1 Tax=Phodopus roborovskii TaxID=109678 RepID=A0AAU9YWE9_PHORO|nr:unknown_gene_16247 [Phodopus roborovskii]